MISASREPTAAGSSQKICWQSRIRLRWIFHGAGGLGGEREREEGKICMGLKKF